MRRRRKARFHIPAKYILFTLSALCVAMMFASFLFDVQFTPLNTAAGYVFIPMQKGINKAGSWAGSLADNLTELKDVMQHNEELQAQVDELTNELNIYKMEQYDIEDMRRLLELDEKYKYEKSEPALSEKTQATGLIRLLLTKATTTALRSI